MDIKELKFLLGVFFSNSASIFFILLIAWLYAFNPNEAFIWTGFIGALVVILIISHYFWKGLQMRRLNFIAYTVLNALVALIWMWWLIG